LKCFSNLYCWYQIIVDEEFRQILDLFCDGFLDAKGTTFIDSDNHIGPLAPDGKTI
jgi:hypothetical protein